MLLPRLPPFVPLLSLSSPVFPHLFRDPVVPVASGLAAYKKLVTLGLRPSFRSLRGVGHGVSGEMMGLLRLFFLSKVGPRWPGGLGGVGSGPAWERGVLERHLRGLSVSELLDFLQARNIDTRT